MDLDGAVAVIGRNPEGRCVGPYHYRDPDIAERVVRLLVMSGYDVTVEELTEPSAQMDLRPRGR